MDKCQSIRNYLFEHFLTSRPETDKTLDPIDLSVKEHILHCASCRHLQADLQKIEARLNDLEAKISSQIQVPPGAYFESLVTCFTGSSQPEPKIKSLMIERASPQGQTGPKGPDFTGILAFLGIGIAFLSGVGVLLQAGFIIPVGVVFGVISILLPLIILFEKPGIKNGEVS